MTEVSRDDYSMLYEKVSFVKSFSKMLLLAHMKEDFWAASEQNMDWMLCCQAWINTARGFWALLKHILQYYIIL